MSFLLQTAKDAKELCGLLVRRWYYTLPTLLAFAMFTSMFADPTGVGWQRQLAQVKTDITPTYAVLEAVAAAFIYGLSALLVALYILYLLRRRYEWIDENILFSRAGVWLMRFLIISGSAYTILILFAEPTIVQAATKLTAQNTYPLLWAVFAPFALLLDGSFYVLTWIFCPQKLAHS